MVEDMRKLGIQGGGYLPGISRHRRRLYNQPRLTVRCSAMDDDDDDDDTSTPT